MNPYLICALLIFLGSILVVLEVFIPSGGILGIVAGTAFVYAVIHGFNEGSTTGLVVLLGSAVAVPIALTIAFKLWPKTPLGKKSIPDPELGESDNQKELDQLIGATAITLTAMMPNGRIRLGNDQLDAVTNGTMIEEGKQVEVVSAVGNRIMVKEVIQSDEPSSHLSEENSESIDYSSFEEDLNELE